MQADVNLLDGSNRMTQVSVTLCSVRYPTVQGPKLTVLCRCQVATEFFFSCQMEKSGRQKVVRKIFAS